MLFKEYKKSLKRVSIEYNTMPHAKAKMYRVQVTLTKAQLDLLDKLVDEGLLGGSRTDVFRTLFLNHMKEKQPRVFLG